MNLRLKSLPVKATLLIVGLFVGFGAVQFGVQKIILYPSFVTLEQREAEKNVARALDALRRELELLGPQVTDWATWDETYAFVQDHNPAYVDANLNAEALENLRINYLAFVDASGTAVWQLAIGLEGQGTLAPHELGFAHFAGDDPLVQLGQPGNRASADRAHAVTGVRASPRGPVLVAAQPIFKTSGEGPARGVVIMARLLDATAVAQIAEQANVDLALLPVAKNSVARPANAASSAVRHDRATYTVTDAIASGITTVFDFKAVPIFQLQVDTPRSISAQGRRTLEFANRSLTIAGSVILLAVLTMFKITVFSPIARLTAHAAHVGKSGDLDARINSQREDEIGVLGREFDAMVARLGDTRALLLEQSYKAGIAELASGVLHNIGNAVTPLRIKLSGLISDLRQAPHEEVAMANAELADPQLDAQRRADLEQFMALAATELTALTQHATDRLSAALGHVDQVQQILADQQRFAHAERVIEDLNVARLIKDCVALLPPNLVDKTSIALAPGLEAAPLVRSSRAVLSQILSNLLINAAEAIVATGVPGRIQISAKLVDQAESALCIEIVDEGIGIEAELLPRLFEAGVSTKNRGSGMGLHWSSNTIAALGGRLSAASDGPGCGARITLVLPLASPLLTQQEKAA